MPKDRLGDKFDRRVEQIKGGVKNLAHKMTEDDNSPRTDAMAGRMRGEVAKAGGAMRRSSAKGRTGSKKAASDLRTKAQLYAEAARIGVKGRSKMTKDQLAKAVRRGRS
ncbi:hypothetical protein AB0F43_12305 [Kribbella sp. NPDC023972]|uniref:hypothetical protein n=1 Tax=Kribbella sp. NPDC023972 TaxID=3154795 RepID=UPI0033F3B4C3